jgi:hypothetical protein
MFKITNVGACIGQWTFELLKPLFVKPMWDRNTCCYIYHVELDELKLGLNITQGQGNSKKVCNHHEHKVCAPCKVFYKGITCLWESIVCPKGDFDEWYKKECLYGNCLACGEGKFFFFV